MNEQQTGRGNGGARRALKSFVFAGFRASDERWVGLWWTDSATSRRAAMAALEFCLSMYGSTIERFSDTSGPYSRFAMLRRERIETLGGILER